MYNIASISLFILLPAQLPRTLNLILENNLVSFEYFSFDSELNCRYANLKLIVDFYYYFLCEFYFILWMFCIFVCIIFVYFWCQELWLFYIHFFHLVFFLVKYSILLMFCFIMYWPTDNSDILRLYNHGSHNVFWVLAWVGGY